MTLENADAAEPFILRHLVREVLSATNEADPGVLAGMVVARIDSTNRDAALSQAMRLFVRQVISETRVGNKPSNVTPIHRSAKVSAIRDGWQRRLRDRVHVGGSTWKQLGDCTYDDLTAAAMERQEHADRNAAWAREYRAMASAVLDAGVDRFADLPVEIQANILGGVA